MPLLVLANQVAAQLTAAGEVRAATSASLLAENALDALGAVSAVHAARIAASLVRSEAAMRQAAEERRVRDEAEVSGALQRLSDVAALRPPSGRRRGDLRTRSAGRGPGGDRRDVRASSCASRRRTTAGQPLFDRLGRFANASGFRIRTIALDGSWWMEEGSHLPGHRGGRGLPRAVVWRRRRWRIVDPQTQGAKSRIDAAGGRHADLRAVTCCIRFFQTR